MLNVKALLIKICDYLTIKSGEPTVSIVTGAIDSLVYYKWGPVILLHGRVHNTIQTTSGNNVFKCNITDSFLLPPHNVTGGNYLGQTAPNASLTSEGVLTVRNASNSKNINANITVSVELMYILRP